MAVAGVIASMRDFGGWRCNGKKRTSVRHRYLRYAVIIECLVIGTWNVRIMNEGKLGIVNIDMERVHVKLMGERLGRLRTRMRHSKSDKGGFILLTQSSAADAATLCASSRH